MSRLHKRPAVLGMEHREIVLKKGEIALVDCDDYERLAQVSWYAVASKGCTYAKTGKNSRMHRVILGVNDPKLIVDHINGNGLDNRKCNLRIVSAAENIKNRQRPSSSKTSIPGVYRSHRQWVARICVDYKNIQIGRFATEAEAIVAVNKFRESIGRPQVVWNT